VGSWNCGGIAISDVVRAAIRSWVSGSQLSWTALRVAVAIIKAGRPSGSGNLIRIVMRAELWSLVAQLRALGVVA
jgi:hypothetical protein